MIDQRVKAAMCTEVPMEEYVEIWEVMKSQPQIMEAFTSHPTALDDLYENKHYLHCGSMPKS